MWHRLGALLGERVPVLQDRMSEDEFCYWCAYYQLEPFGPRADAERHAQKMATVSNIYRDRDKHPAPLPVSDFMPEGSQ